MDNAGYVALTRLGGLSRELEAVANNLANMSTGGFRREGVVFAEMVERAAVEGGALSMTSAHVRATSFAPAVADRTGGVFDLAIEGEGFFQVESPEGDILLTRSGSFLRDQEGMLATQDGRAVLDEAGAPIPIPPEAGTMQISSDGTVTSDGRAVARIAVVDVPDRSELMRRDGVYFISPQEPVPVETPVVLQGHLEGSNVNPVQELSRMITIQRAYEQAASLLEQDDERIRGVVRTLGRGG